jgi:hypothetical protein
LQPAATSRALLFVILPALLTACGESEDVKQYKASKEAAVAPRPGGEMMAGPSKGAMPNPASGPSRILGAIVPHGDRTWFFKLMGPMEPMSRLAEPFSQFVQSIKFTSDAAKPIEWSLPEGWTQLPGDGMRFATLQIGPAEKKLGVSVFAFGGGAGGMLENVNRWRGQIGLDPIDAAALEKQTRTVEQNGDKVTLVDMKGPGIGGGGEMMAATPKGSPGGAPPLLARPDAVPDLTPAPATEPLPKPDPGERPKLTYAVPAGWKEQPAGGFRAASFAIGEGEKPAQVSVIPLGGQAGGDLANFNRWRGQVGLPGATDAELAALVKPIEVGGVKAKYAEALGAEEGLLAAWLENDNATWFFKLNGPVKVVNEQKAAFEAFLKSVKFTGAADAR